MIAGRVSGIIQSGLISPVVSIGAGVAVEKLTPLITLGVSKIEENCKLTSRYQALKEERERTDEANSVSAGGDEAGRGYLGNFVDNIKFNAEMRKLEKQAAKAQREKEKQAKLEKQQEADAADANNNSSITNAKSPVRGRRNSDPAISSKNEKRPTFMDAWLYSQQTKLQFALDRQKATKEVIDYIKDHPQETLDLPTSLIPVIKGISRGLKGVSATIKGSKEILRAVTGGATKLTKPPSGKIIEGQVIKGGSSNNNSSSSSSSISSSNSTNFSSNIGSSSGNNSNLPVINNQGSITNNSTTTSTNYAAKEARGVQAFKPNNNPGDLSVGVGRAPEYRGGITKESEFLNCAKKFLGENYKILPNGRYVSKDGLRQVRYGKHETTSRNHHAHFEAYDKPNGRIIENTSIKIISD